MPLNQPTNQKVNSSQPTRPSNRQQPQMFIWHLKPHPHRSHHIHLPPRQPTTNTTNNKLLSHSPNSHSPHTNKQYRRRTTNQIQNQPQHRLQHPTQHTLSQRNQIHTHLTNQHSQPLRQPNQQQHRLPNLRQIPSTTNNSTFTTQLLRRLQPQQRYNRPHQNTTTQPPPNTLQPIMRKGTKSTALIISPTKRLRQPPHQRPNQNQSLPLRTKSNSPSHRQTNNQPQHNRLPLTNQTNTSHSRQQPTLQQTPNPTLHTSTITTRQHVKDHRQTKRHKLKANSQQIPRPNKQAQRQSILHTLHLRHHQPTNLSTQPNTNNQSNRHHTIRRRRTLPSLHTPPKLTISQSPNKRPRPKLPRSSLQRMRRSPSTPNQNQQQSISRVRLPISRPNTHPVDQAIILLHRTRTRPSTNNNSFSHTLSTHNHTSTRHINQRLTTDNLKFTHILYSPTQHAHRALTLTLPNTSTAFRTSVCRTLPKALTQLISPNPSPILLINRGPNLRRLITFLISNRSSTPHKLPATNLIRLSVPSNTRLKPNITAIQRF